MKKRVRIISSFLLTAVMTVMLMSSGIALWAQSGVSENVQEVEALVSSFSYPVITVEAGKPVRINFKVASANDLNACNNEIIIPAFNIKKVLAVGDNYVEFTPESAGTVNYSCWMNMIRSTIIVTEPAAKTSATTPAQTGTTWSYTQPTTSVTTTASAEEALKFQKSTVSYDGDIAIIDAKVGPGGFSNIVIEAGKTVRINFCVDAADLNACNNEIYIPEWGKNIKLAAGDNYLELTPSKTGVYTYTCWMGMLSGMITVVEAGSGQIGALPLGDTAYQQSACPMMSGYGSTSGFGSGFGSGSGSVSGCCGGRMRVK